MSRFEMPPVFWTDLSHWLGLLVETHAEQLLSLKGHYSVDRLTPFIERARNLLNAHAQGWDADARSKVRFLLANALLAYASRRK